MDGKSKQPKRYEDEGVARTPGRPITRKIDPVHATADEIARAIFAAAPPPDPSRRIIKNPKSRE